MMEDPRCEHCKRVIAPVEPRLTFHEKEFSLCMSCERATIDVYRLELDGDYFLDPDPRAIFEEISNMDTGDKYIVSKETVLHSKLLSLPEFDGF